MPTSLVKTTYSCGKHGETTEFYVWNSGKRACKLCHLVKSKKARETDKGKARLKAYRAANYNSAYFKQWWLDNAARVGAKRAKDAITLREDIVRAYGGKCVCCGESIPQFLTIDHTDGNVGRYKISGGRSGPSSERTGATLYRYLRRTGFPKDRFRLMCFNCNSGRARNKGVCPHVAP